MFGTNKKAEFSPVVASSTNSISLIGENVEVVGDINFSGALQIDGKVRGTVKSARPDASLIITDKALIEGEIHVPQVRVNGEVRGDIHAANLVEVSGQARIRGNVSYKRLEMASGAAINGQLTQTESQELTEAELNQRA